MTILFYFFRDSKGSGSESRDCLASVVRGESSPLRCLQVEPTHVIKSRHSTKHTTCAEQLTLNLPLGVETVNYVPLII